MLRISIAVLTLALAAPLAATAASAEEFAPHVRNPAPNTGFDPGFVGGTRVAALDDLPALAAPPTPRPGPKPAPGLSASPKPGSTELEVYDIQFGVSIASEGTSRQRPGMNPARAPGRAFRLRK
jgi:hypothetical protein